MPTFDINWTTNKVMFKMLQNKSCYQVDIIEEKEGVGSFYE